MISPTNTTQPPADLAWTAIGDNLLTTDHNGTRWALGAHSVHRGKAGWSGTGEWHLHKVIEPGGDEEVGYVLGDILADRGRWLAHPRNLKRAKALAAWMVTNPRLYDTESLVETEKLAFPQEVTQ